MSRTKLAAPFLIMVAVAGCGGGDGSGPNPSPSPTPTPSPSPSPPTVAVSAATVATLDNPWAMTFLPDGRMLVTEKLGRLRVVTQAGAIGTPISDTPAVDAAGQGGLLDVALDPAYASNNRIYLSFSEAGTGGSGLAVMRATLTIDANGAGAIRA